MRSGRIKIGFYVELTDFRESELDKARHLVQQLQEVVTAPPRCVPDFDAAVKAARSLPPSPTHRDMEQQDWTLKMCEQNRWVVAKAAKDLGISPHRLSTRLQKYKDRGLIAYEGTKWRRR